MGLQHLVVQLKSSCFFLVWRDSTEVCKTTLSLSLPSQENWKSNRTQEASQCHSRRVGHLTEGRKTNLGDVFQTERSPSSWHFYIEFLYTDVTPWPNCKVSECVEKRTTAIHLQRTNGHSPSCICWLNGQCWVVAATSPLLMNVLQIILEPGQWITVIVSLQGIIVIGEQFVERAIFFSAPPVKVTEWLNLFSQARRKKEGRKDLRLK